MTTVGMLYRRTRTMVATPLKRWKANRAFKRGYTSEFTWPSTAADAISQGHPNPLQKFIEERRQGAGIWKWNHYSDIYDRHFRHFRGKETHVLEIGVYSGGSLEMWREYFGPLATIYGVDIQPDCRVYETDRTKIFIGDQADRSFWREFRQKVPVLDIVIDDGGHAPEQQIVTLEELLPFLRPGGVYLCEDVHWAYNQFASYVNGLSHRLNDFSQIKWSPDDDERRGVCTSTPFQSAVGSIHLYPFVTVIERNTGPVTEFRAPKRGTQWQPFLK
jgi:hypothetical protein